MEHYNIYEAELRHPESTRLTFSGNGKTKGPRSQSKDVAAVLSCAMATLHHDIFFGKYPIYPATEDGDIVAGTAIKRAAQELNSSAILKRIKNDDEYLCNLISVVSRYHAVIFCTYAV